MITEESENASRTRVIERVGDDGGLVRRGKIGTDGELE